MCMHTCSLEHEDNKNCTYVNEIILQYKNTFMVGIMVGGGKIHKEINHKKSSFGVIYDHLMALIRYR